MNALGNASADPPPAEVETGNIGAFLSPGWGGEATSIGPELGFGWAVGDALAGFCCELGCRQPAAAGRQPIKR